MLKPVSLSSSLAGGAQLLKIHRIVSTFYQLFEEGRYEEEGRIIEETIENGLPSPVHPASSRRIF